MAISGYLWSFQTPLLARREYAFALLLWFLLIPLVYFLLTRFLLPRLLGYSPKARRNWILLSAGVGILFALVTHPPQAILLLPVHHLQINLPGEARIGLSRSSTRRPPCAISVSENFCKREIGNEPKQGSPTPVGNPLRLPGAAVRGKQPRSFFPIRQALRKSRQAGMGTWLR